MFVTTALFVASVMLVATVMFLTTVILVTTVMFVTTVMPFCAQSMHIKLALPQAAWLGIFFACTSLTDLN